MRYNVYVVYNVFKQTENKLRTRYSVALARPSLVSKAVCRTSVYNVFISFGDCLVSRSIQWPIRFSYKPLPNEVVQPHQAELGQAKVNTTRIKQQTLYKSYFISPLRSVFNNDNVYILL